jgi:hypothetical protein
MSFPRATTITAQPSMTMPRNRNSAGASRELRAGAIAEGMGKPEGVTDGQEASGSVLTIESKK